MNLPRCGRAIHERCLVLGAGHSERVDLVDVSSCRILLSVTMKRFSLDQKRLVSYERAIVIGMSTKERSSSQTRTQPSGTVAIRCPYGPYRLDHQEAVG